MFGAFLFRSIAQTYSQIVYRPSDRVEKCRTSAGRIVIFRQRLNLIKGDVLVQHLITCIEQDCRDICLALDFSLFFDKFVEPSYCVLFKRFHRAAAVKHKNNFRQIFFHKTFPCILFYVFLSTQF